MIVDKVIGQLFRDFVMSPEFPVYEHQAGRHRLGDKVSAPYQALDQVVPNPGKLVVIPAVPEDEAVVFGNDFILRLADVFPVI